MMQNHFILTSADRTTAMGFSNPAGEIDPRSVDNSSPGTGINLNNNASNYDPGEAVPLTSTYVAPKRIVDDSEYGTDLKTFLLTRPWASLENETIFAPPED